MVVSRLSSMIIFYFLVQYASTDCPDTYLYCFNSEDTRLGEIRVPQCWAWSRLSCQPCSANIDARIITYHEYIHYCRYYYPETVQIFSKRNIRSLMIRNILNKIAVGK